MRKSEQNVDIRQDFHINGHEGAVQPVPLSPVVWDLGVLYRRITDSNSTGTR